MERDKIRELHFITPVENIESILRRGILCHQKAAKINHKSVALEDVQDIRRLVRVPNGGMLHSYANVYIHARNPMMFYLTRNGHEDLVVLRVSTDILDLRDVVVTDGNAASTGTRFFPSPEGISELQEDLVFARYWTDGNFWPIRERKRARNAEVLVPSVIESNHIIGCYVDTPGKLSVCREMRELPDVARRKEIFFQ